MTELDKQLDKMQFAITRDIGVQAQFSQLRNFLQDEQPDDNPPEVVPYETVVVNQAEPDETTKDLFDDETLETKPTNGEDV